MNSIYEVIVLANLLSAMQLRYVFYVQFVYVLLNYCVHLHPYSMKVVKVVIELC